MKSAICRGAERAGGVVSGAPVPEALVGVLILELPLLRDLLPLPTLPVPTAGVAVELGDFLGITRIRALIKGRAQGTRRGREKKPKNGQM